MTAIKFYASAADVLKAVEGISRKAKTLQEDIHKAAVSACKLLLDKKVDHLVFVQMVNAIQNASPYHANAFSKWVGLYLPLQWADETKAWFANEKECILYGDQFIAIRDTPFWKVSPAPKAQPFDMYAELERIIEKARKRMAKPVDGDRNDMRLANKLVDLLKEVKEAQASEE